MPAVTVEEDEASVEVGGITEPSTVRSQEPGGAEWCVEIVHLNSHCGHSPSEGEKVSKSDFLLLETEEDGGPDEVEAQLSVIQLKGTVRLGSPRGSYGTVKGLDSKMRGVTHESVKDSPYWTKDFLGGVTGRRCHGSKPIAPRALSGNKTAGNTQANRKADGQDWVTSNIKKNFRQRRHVGC